MSTFRLLLLAVGALGAWHVWGLLPTLLVPLGAPTLAVGLVHLLLGHHGWLG